MEPHFDAYLQHGAGTAGPFMTEKINVRHNPRATKESVNPPWASSWEARVDGGWRRIWIDGHNRFIRLHGETVKIKVALHDEVTAN